MIAPVGVVAVVGRQRLRVPAAGRLGDGGGGFGGRREDAIGVVQQGVLQNIEIDFVIEGTHGLFPPGDDVATPVEGVGIGTMLCPHFACLVCIF
jgi:hypothetical protein